MRSRVLLHQHTLTQAGSERALYTVAIGLDAARFEVAVLTRPSSDDHYAERLRGAGFPIVEFDPSPPPRGQWLPGPLRSRVEARLFRRDRARVGRRLRGLLEGSDLLAVFLVESYIALQEHLRPGDRVALFHQSHEAQYVEPPFSRLRPVPGTHVVLMHENQAPEIARTPLAGLPWHVQPHLLDVAGTTSRYRPPGGPPWKIGVFSRLSPHRPLEPFFYALQSLRRHADARLHVYGAGDPRLFEPQLRQLDLRAAVVFEGHRTDIGATLDEGLALGWMLSHGDFMGFACLEMAALGMPLLFWNLGALPHDAEGAVAPAGSVDELARRTLELLSDPGRLRARGAALRQHVLERHDLSRRREALNALFQALSTRA